MYDSADRHLFTDRNRRQVEELRSIEISAGNVEQQVPDRRDSGIGELLSTLGADAFDSIDLYVEQVCEGSPGCLVAAGAHGTMMAGPRSKIVVSERLLASHVTSGGPLNMSYRCEICDKEPWFGKQVSFSHKRSSRRWLPNIQKVRVRDGSNSKRIRVCTSCIKAGKIEKV